MFRRIGKKIVRGRLRIEKKNTLCIKIKTRVYYLIVPITNLLIHDALYRQIKLIRDLLIIKLSPRIQEK